MNWKWIWRILLYFAGNRMQDRMVKSAKRQGVLAYLKVLDGTRRLLFAGLMVFFFLQMMMLSLMGALVTGIYLWDYDFQSKIQILFGIFLGTFLLPAGLLVLALSERVWYRFSGAKRMMDDLEGRRHSKHHSKAA